MGEGKKVSLTQEAYQRLKEELEYKVSEERARIIDEIAVARAHGDLSENAEYHAAKDRQGLEEARIRILTETLENAEIIQSEDDGIAKPGKLVTIRHEGEEPETYLLGSREERGDYDVLTPESPLGQAIVGRSAGDRVTAKAPRGDLHVEIVAVESR